MDRLRLAAARYRLGAETAESLRALGEHLLAEGHDEAVKLAILESDAMYDAGPVFERLCAELGQPIPTLDQAIDIAAAAVLREIVDGSAAPEDGLRRLSYDVEYEADSSHGLQDFFRAYVTYEYLHSDEVSIEGLTGNAGIALLDRKVVQFASDWLADHATDLPC